MYIMSNHEEIIASAMDYVFGVAENDRQRIERGYDVPRASMQLIDNQNGQERTFNIPISAVWDKIWSKRPRNKNHRAEIISLHVSGGRMASITIDNNGDFIDQLSLYKLNGQWKIVNKLAIRHPDAEPLQLDLEGLFGPQ